MRDQRDKILEIAAKNVRVFGSVVRGEATAEGDIDFLIDLGKKLSPWFSVGLIHDLEELLDHEVGVVTAKTLCYLIRDRILQATKPL